jgi:hypothetical protein
MGVLAIIGEIVLELLLEGLARLILAVGDGIRRLLDLARRAARWWFVRSHT